VVSGDTVKIYNDPTCTTLVGSAVSAATSVSILVTFPGIGIHNLYTRSTNITGTVLLVQLYVLVIIILAITDRYCFLTANRENAVNKTGGGYRVYHSTTYGFDPANPHRIMASLTCLTQARSNSKHYYD